ncbi:MAG TPA: beta-phosphoglucomutase family hydrolase [Acidimicrobiia bacterium]|nr:beta-phosphoglucomutase family hydrolase [Acidimicrobiia bacterium]
MLGLPDGIRAGLFDLDGVLTRTATVHAAAWKEMFDDFLRRRAQETGEPFVPFDAHADYDRFVDGKKRADGVRSFLASRGIDLPDGDPDDPAGAATVHGLGNRKNELVLAKLAGGVDVYPGSVRYVEAARDAGLRRAVVSSSANTETVLKVTGLADLFEVVVDGVVAAREGLPGKPAPDMFLAAARALDVAPPEAAVFEDALAGVEAGRAGGFGFVVGVDRTGQAEELRRHGADIVVADLADLLGLESA